MVLLFEKQKRPPPHCADHCPAEQLEDSHPLPRGVCQPTEHAESRELWRRHAVSPKAPVPGPATLWGLAELIEALVEGTLFCLEKEIFGQSIKGGAWICQQDEEGRTSQPEELP